MKKYVLDFDKVVNIFKRQMALGNIDLDNHNLILDDLHAIKREIQNN